MRKLVQIIVLVLVMFIVQVSSGLAQEPVVRAILLYSPSCPHCQKVITEDLPPIIQLYDDEPQVLYIPPTAEEEPVGPPLVGIFGKSLEILYVNVYTELGQNLYQEAVELFNIPPDLQVVPIMIVNDQLLIGGNEIPNQLPGIIEEGLASGGTDWADLPGLSLAMDALIPAPTEPPPAEETEQEPSASAVPSENATEAPADQTPSGPTSTTTAGPSSSVNNPAGPLVVENLSVLEKIKLDLAGNILAIIVLIAMIVSVAMVSSRLILPDETGERQEASWLIPILCTIGIGVAAYLTYVESSGVEAVCGPVGNCNTVQDSKYAVLFGVLPVGTLGLAGYAGIVLVWLVARLGRDPWINWAKLALFGMSLFGTLFSIYLTFLEPFVIGATCMWCLSSAIIMTLLLWLTVGPASEAVEQIRGT
jgi:uncharacterized membrane protein